MIRLFSSTVLIGMIGCGDDVKNSPIETEEADVVGEIWDADGDGYLSDEDCDDSVATINPGEPEICDGLDNDCDGDIDEGVLRTFHLDEDGDGFGQAEVAAESCEAPEGMVQNGGDCDDDDQAIFPGALEICDEIDNDCDGDIDDGLGNWWYVDIDADGYGDVTTAQQTCAAPEGYVLIGGDCDDANNLVFPGAIEECDGVDNNWQWRIGRDGNPHMVLR